MAASQSGKIKRSGRVAIGMAALLVGAAATIIAQDRAGRGGGRPAAPPNPLGQPLLDSSGHEREDAFIHAPLRPEDAKYADLDGLHMKSILNEVMAISRKDRDSGNVFWGRNVGTPGHAATEDWVEGYFRKYGLQNVHRQSFDLRPQWIPKRWNISFESGDKTLQLGSARPEQGAASTPPGGLDLELVWAGEGTAADFVGRDVTGKAALIQDIPTPGVINHSINYEGAVQRAFEKGAAAVGIVYGISDNFAVWEGSGGRPGFNVGYQDGKRLRDLLGNGQPVRVKIQLESEMRPGLKTASVLGTLPGTTDEEILVMAHIDGFFEGALDNASGVAVMMGLLEHFAMVPQSQRRRNIRFMGSAGHHGGPGAGWLHNSRETELAKTALMFNLEHVAAVRTKYWGPRLRMTTAVAPMRWWVYGSGNLLDIALKSFSRFNVGITADMDDGASGEMGAVARDAPSIQVITSPEVKHTEQDTAEWVPANGLEQIARAYAKIIDDVNKLDRNDILPASSKSSATGGLGR
ncbi:MAG TPA: M28 family peptidase [Bryobacteraceae bacterium]|nr:M28 family peptidase [Bryobacteraceae bacterium]